MTTPLERARREARAAIQDRVNKKTGTSRLQQARRAARAAIQERTERRLEPDNTFRLRKGILLYRAVDDITPYDGDLYALRNVCTDTGKKGLYFATGPLLSLAMAVEYDRSMELGVFQTTADIRLSVGKYGFRTARYFEPDGTIRLGIVPTQQQNISHYDPEIRAILPGIDDYPVPAGAEVFLADRPSLEKLRLIGKYIIRKEPLKRSLRRYGADPERELDSYVREKVLVKFS
jgi:hypothetical protein